MSEKKSPFPMPSEIEDAPGAENWAEMYPYYTHVQPEDDERFWFYNSMHFSEPMSAFDMITAESAYHAMGAFVSLESHPKIQTIGQPLSIEFIDIWAARKLPNKPSQKKE